MPFSRSLATEMKLCWRHRELGDPVSTAGKSIKVVHAPRADWVKHASDEGRMHATNLCSGCAGKGEDVLKIGVTSTREADSSQHGPHLR